MDQKPILVLVHGVGLDATMWDGVIAELDDQFDCRAMTMPGHGSMTTLPPEDIDGFIEALSAALADEDDGPVDLVGFSMGAMVAAGFAAAFPDRVRKLVLMNAVHKRSGSAREAVMMRLEEARESGLAPIADAAIARWFSDDFVRDNAETIATMKRVLLANDLNAYLRAYKVFATSDAEIAARLPDISCPVLAMTGGRDVNSTADMCRQIADEVQNGTHLIFDDLAHGAPVEDPKRVADAIRAFMMKDDTHA